MATQEINIDYSKWSAAVTIPRDVKIGFGI